MTDDELARHAVLRAEDLPGEGWSARSADGAGAGGGADEPWAAGFPEEAVTASAESPQFLRDDAFAWSASWVLATEADAKAAEARLADPAFVRGFMVAAAGGADAGGGAYAGATGPVAVHVDLLAVRVGPVVTLLLLADTPDPLPGAAIAARLRARLA